MTTHSILKTNRPSTIIAVGSIDGVLSAGALLFALRQTATQGEREIRVVFTQAFTVDKIDLSTFRDSEAVAFVDLAVNSRDSVMTQTFVSSLLEEGHKIVAICDEHNAEDWQTVCQATGVVWEDLAILPVSQENGDIKSSGALLLQALGGEELPLQFKDLCLAADAADHMRFEDHAISDLCNRTLKSNIKDDTMRYRMVEWVSHPINLQEVPYEIASAVQRYNQVEKNGERALQSAILLGEVLMIQSTDLQIDVTTVTRRGYDRAPIVAIFFKSGEETKVSLSRAPGDKRNLLDLARSVGLEPSGFEAKITIPASGLLALLQKL